MQKCEMPLGAFVQCREMLWRLNWQLLESAYLFIGFHRSVRHLTQGSQSAFGAPSVARATVWGRYADFPAVRCGCKSPVDTTTAFVISVGT